MTTFPTVYILGAGCSAHAGVPLLGDFLNRARSLPHIRSDLHFRQEFQIVFDWIDSLRGANAYLSIDLENLEHVFSLLEVSHQLRQELAESRYEALVRVTSETIDEAPSEWDGNKPKPDRVYSSFIRGLSDAQLRRSERVQKDSFERDSIVTLNYDILLDYALQCLHQRIDYGLEQGGRHGDVEYLKLHGSLNWGWCAQCERDQKADQRIQVLAIREDRRKAGHEAAIPRIGQPMPIHVHSGSMRFEQCATCGIRDRLLPVLVPPTWAKRLRYEQLTNVWGRALAALTRAERLVIVGYSMPETDTFFRYLLQLGLAKNTRLRNVLVVNRDQSATLRERYQSAFSREMSLREKLKFNTGTFQEFVAKMDQYLGP